MIKKNIIPCCLFLFSLLFCENLYAVPAIPYPITVTQPDGSTLQTRLKGDEFFRYRTTLDGYLIEKNDEGFFVYAQLKDKENIVATNIQVSNIEKRTSKEIQLLETQEQNPDLRVVNEQRRAQRTTKLSSSSDIQKAFPLNGNPRSLVILVNFSDKSFTVENPNEAFTDLLNQEGYSANGGTGSARDYFISSSMEQFAPQFDVVGPYNLPNNIEYYGRNSAGADLRPRQMIIDACYLAHADGVNFSEYDTDNNGYVDNVFVFYAGYNEAEGGPVNTIWPHRWELSPTLTLDGVRVRDYACTSELKGNNGVNMCGIGTFVHEFGHVLGLPDFYATNNATHHTLFEWSVMDYGSYLNDGRTPPAYSAYERFFLGWITPIEIKKPTYVTLDTLTTSNTAYIITQNGDHNLNGGNPNPTEFFMLENRQQTGWDKFLPNSGMLITHINYNAAAWRNNEVNNSAVAMRVDIMEADGIASKSTLSGDPFPGANNIKTYNPRLRNGNSIDKSIEEIEEIDGKIYFVFMGWGLQISADEELSLFETVQGTPSKEQYIYLSGTKIEEDILVELAGLENSHFEIKLENENEWKKSLIIQAPANSIINNLEIAIRYNPTQPSILDIHNEIIRCRTQSAYDVSINIDGKSTRPVSVVAPTALNAEDITPYSFNAVWKSVYDATCYYLTVRELSATNRTTLVVENLLVNDTAYTVQNLLEKKYFYKIKASDKKFNNNNMLLYENITDFSNEIMVDLPDNLPNKALQVVNHQDGTVTVYIPSTKEPLYVYNTIGMLLREIDSNTNIITINDLPRNHIYILKSGDRWIKMFF